MSKYFFSGQLVEMNGRKYEYKLVKYKFEPACPARGKDLSASLSPTHLPKYCLAHVNSDITDKQLISQSP